jgi:hypothetical protein
MKTKSNGSGSSAASSASVSSAGPSLISTVSRQPRAGDARGGDVGGAAIDLERDQPAAGRQRPCEPDRAVAAERADLEDPPRADRAREQV